MNNLKFKIGDKIKLKQSYSFQGREIKGVGKIIDIDSVYYHIDVLSHTLTAKTIAKDEFQIIDDNCILYISPSDIWKNLNEE